MKNESLPAEIDPPEHARRWWVPMAGAVVMVLLANVVLMFCGVRHRTGNEERMLAAKWSLAGDRGRSFDWIVVGDSSGAFGVDPASLAKDLSGDCVNLCTFGSMGISGDAWMLEHYLANHASPQGVIIVHAADVWVSDQGDAFYQYAAAMPISTSSLLSRLVRLGSSPSELFITLRYRDWFPLLQLKDDLRGILGWSPDDESMSTDRSQMPADGSLRLPASEARPEAVAAQSATYLSAGSEKTSFDWRYRSSLDRIIALAREKKICVYLANGPIAKPALELPHFQTSLRGVTSQLTSLAASETYVSYILRDWVAFAPEEMQNCNHIVGPAVDDYTHALAEAILNAPQ